MKTFMFNGLLQTPVPIARMQFYGTAGGGVYRETLSTRAGRRSHQLRHQHRRRREDLAGRADPRSGWTTGCFRCRGTPRHTNAQRLYAGINLKF